LPDHHPWSALLLTLLLLLLACSPPPSPADRDPASPATTPSSARGPVLDTLPATIDPAASYLFFLHGRIVEDQGRRGVSPEYGPYQYDAMLDAFARAGLTVVSEARAKDTEPLSYAERIAGEVRRLLAAGVPPGRITVAGASKGALIAMLVSTALAKEGEEGVGFVLVGNCNDWVREHHRVDLHGEVLSIYEASDDIGQSCAPLFAGSPRLGRHAEVRLETGLGHGYLYRPLPQWLRPALAWAARRAL
jgi:hypothetical protein